MLPGLLSLEAPPELAASAVLLPDEGPLAEAPSALALALLPELLWLVAPPLAALDESLLAEEEPPEEDVPALALLELSWAAPPPLGPAAPLDDEALLPEEESEEGPLALALAVPELPWAAALPPGLAGVPLGALNEPLLLEALPPAPAAGTVGPWVLLKDLPNPIWEAAAASGARLASAALGAAPASAVLGA